MTITDTLAERSRRYGSFDKHAELAQELKLVMQANPKWFELADDQREALDMIQHKIARILNGDPNYPDNWHDIAGYATLVDDRLNAMSAARTAPPQSMTAEMKAAAALAPTSWMKAGDKRAKKKRGSR